MRQGRSPSRTARRAGAAASGSVSQPAWARALPRRGGRRARSVVAASTSTRRSAQAPPRAGSAARESRATSVEPPLAGPDDPDESRHEVVLGRDLVDVGAGTERRRAQLGLSLLSRLTQAVPELVIARVDGELVAGLRILDHDHARIRELVLTRVEKSDRDDLVP